MGRPPQPPPPSPLPHSKIDYVICGRFIARSSANPLHNEFLILSWLPLAADAISNAGGSGVSGASGMKKNFFKNPKSEKRLDGKKTMDISHFLDNRRRPPSKFPLNYILNTLIKTDLYDEKKI